MLHKELRLSEIKQTTGVSFERVRMAIQGLINLRIISVVNYFNSDPLFRITDYLAGKSFLEEIALLKVERS
jgi:DNA-binding transcriptional regulator GbsR (MarR family)